MNDEVISPAAATLLGRLQAAIASRPVPTLAGCCMGDEQDNEWCVRTLRGLWGEGEPVVTSQSMFIDEAFIWLENPAFRYAFLRLMQLAVGTGHEAATEALLTQAAIPVPAQTVVPPVFFAEFPPAEIVLVRDVIGFLVDSVDLSDRQESARRVAERARRNWIRYAAAAGGVRGEGHG